MGTTREVETPAFDRNADVDAGGTPLAGQDPHEPRIELSFVMPCLNEAATLGVCVRAAQEALRTLSIDGEIIVADNGSTDGTVESPRPSERGSSGFIRRATVLRCWAASLRRAASSSSWATPTPPMTSERSVQLVEKLRAGHDLVMGNRFSGGVAPGAMPWLNRRIGNPVLTGLGRLFFRSPVRDFHCGLRGFRKDAMLALDLQSTGMEFASELVVKATLAELAVTEVPTTLSRGSEARKPHLRPWRDGWRHLRFLLIYSPRWLFLYPGLLLMALGAAATLWLLPGPRTVGGVTFDVQTLLFASMTIVIGFQAVLFSVLGKVFAWQEGLLPTGEGFQRLFRYITLEVGLAVGVGTDASRASPDPSTRSCAGASSRSESWMSPGP